MQCATDHEPAPHPPTVPCEDLLLGDGEQSTKSCEGRLQGRDALSLCSRGKSALFIWETPASDPAV